jgi:hypothetical protein
MHLFGSKDFIKTISNLFTYVFCFYLTRRMTNLTWKHSSLVEYKKKRENGKKIQYIKYKKYEMR